MRWKYYNPNPSANLVGDCVVRALSLALDRSWDSVYIDISSQGYAMHKAEMEGYSRDYARDYSRGYSEDYANAYGSYNSYARRGRDGDGDGRYSERGRDGGSYRDNSYNRSYDGYSGHNKEDMIGHLQEMMRNARSEEEKESYRRALEQMKR